MELGEDVAKSKEIKAVRKEAAHQAAVGELIASLQ